MGGLLEAPNLKNRAPASTGARFLQNRRFRKVFEKCLILASFSEVKTTKYRETMLVNCNNRLSTLDGKEIDHRQRDALIRFAQHRMNKKKRMKAQRQDNGANHPQYSRQPLAQNQQRNY